MKKDDHPILGVADLSEDHLEEIDVVAEVIQLDAYRMNGNESMYRNFCNGQVAGLNEWALNLVDEVYVKCWRQIIDTYPDGRVEESILEGIIERRARKEESGEFFPGVDGSAFPLYKHVFENGEVYYEFLQEMTKTGTAVFFLALKQTDGRTVIESLWTEDEMAKYLGTPGNPCT